MTTPTPIPIVAIVEQPDGTFPDPERRVAPAASRYHAMQEAAATVLNHLVVSPIAQARLLMMMLNFYLDYKPASAAFDQKFGNRPPPDLALINQYFLTSPPTIVLCSPADLDRGIPRNGVAWGTVLKGSPQPKSGAKSGEDDAESEAGNTDGVDMPVEEKNEVFMPIDLAERLEVITATSTIDAKRRRLVWSVAFMHELVHCLSKYLFSGIVTPLLPGDSLGRDNKGEAGNSFELLYLGFKVQVEWLNGDVHNANRMEKMLHVLAKTTRHTYELDDRMVSQLLASFEGSALSLPDFTNPGFTPYKCLDPSTHRRYWTGSFTCDESEEEAKEPWREARVETEQMPMLRTINVGLRTFGLKCRLVNEVQIGEDEQQDSC